tara:strand:- start:778 stop:1527 length:750 start_codon:yes stop_codon:yes gene_type:complete
MDNMNIEEMQKQIDLMQKLIKSKQEEEARNKELNEYIEYELEQYNALDETEKINYVRELLLNTFEPSKNKKLNDKVKQDILYINQSDKIWYMNGNHEDIKIWDTFVKNKLVLTWNKDGTNESIKTKIKKNDIIAWHIRTKGFNSILRVTDNPKILSNYDDNNLLKYYPAWEHKYTFNEWKQNAFIKNYERIYIPVEFLATTDKYFVKQNSIKNWTYDWSICRGSKCISPSNPHWKEQVIEIYKYLINKL